MKKQTKQTSAFAKAQAKKVADAVKAAAAKAKLSAKKIKKVAKLAKKAAKKNTKKALKLWGKAKKGWKLKYKKAKKAAKAKAKKIGKKFGIWGKKMKGVFKVCLHIASCNRRATIASEHRTCSSSCRSEQDMHLFNGHTLHQEDVLFCNCSTL